MRSTLSAALTSIVLKYSIVLKRCIRGIELTAHLLFIYCILNQVYKMKGKVDVGKRTIIVPRN